MDLSLLHNPVKYFQGINFLRIWTVTYFVRNKTAIWAVCYWVMVMDDTAPVD
jgi:hypothetical protein